MKRGSITNQIVLIIAISCMMWSLGIAENQTESWEAKLQSDLPVLGHRNWIVIADSAYPKQSSAGIETLYTGENQLDVVNKVLTRVYKSTHVQANVLVDEELFYVNENDAPGITAYREQLNALLNGLTTIVMPHEKIIDRLDKESQIFNVLLLKTTMTLPYTSVFLELNCGYWDSEKEERLREIMKTEIPDE